MFSNTARNELFNEYSRIAGEVFRPDADTARSVKFFRLDQSAEAGVALDGVDRISLWVQKVRALEEFVTSVGRLPRENNRKPRAEIPQEERALADWVAYQRRPATRDLHCTYQRRRLEAVPEFSWHPLEDRWDAMFADYAAFVGTYLRIPRYRAADTHERALASWMAKQRHATRRGALSVHRSKKLRQAAIEHRTDGE